MLAATALRNPASRSLTEKRRTISLRHACGNCSRSFDLVVARIVVGFRRFWTCLEAFGSRR